MDKILKIQTEIGTLAKDKKNPFFKSSYFDVNQILAQLIPLLEKHNLTVLQPLSELNGEPALRTIIADDKGVIIDDKIPMPKNPDAQKMGSAITYYRRYALQSLFLLQAEDDDGNKAKPKPVVKVNLTTDHENYDKVKSFLSGGGDIKEVEKKYILSDEIKKELNG